MNFPKQDPSGHMASRLPELSVEFYFRNDIMALYKWYLSCKHCLKEEKKKTNPKVFYSAGSNLVTPTSPKADWPYV